MGFAVHCEGADLIRNFQKSEDDVLGRRYPLYIIALATEIDDEAIKWLAEYSRAIDSLTGQAIAFITFYNSARFYASTGFRTTRFVDYEGTRRVFQYPLPTIQVPPNALQSSWALRNYVAGRMHFPDEAFVSSMTYASDSVARYLGIKPTELPCFVFIDDPGGKEYYLLSMDPLGPDLMSKMREVVGDFYSLDAHKPYFELIEKWDALQMKLLRYQEAVKKTHESLRDLREKFPKTHIDFATIFECSDPNTAQRQVESWLSDVFGQAVPREIKSSLLPPLASVAVDLHRVQKARSAAEYFKAALASGSLSQKDQINLLRLYRRTLCHLLPDTEKTPKNVEKMDAVEWKRFLDISLSDSNPVITAIEQKRLALQNMINIIDLQSIREYRTSPIETALKQAEQEVANVKGAIDALKRELDKIERPRIGSILRRLKWGERRESTAGVFRRTVHVLGEGSDTIIKALELGMKASGML